jgi:hypothetical protein
VLEVRDRDVIIDIGANEGASVDMNAEIYHVETVDLGLGQGAQQEAGNVTGRVTLVAADRASVHLAIHEHVESGWLVRFVDRQASSNRTYPPRPRSYFEVEGVLRPFIGQGGVGTHSEIGMSYHFGDAPVRLRGRVDPLEANKDFGGGAPHAIISYDGRLLEMGLGVGGATKGVFDDKPVVTLPVYLRLGATDGVMGELTNNFSLGSRSVELGSLRLSGYAPIAESMWIALRLEGTRSGGYLEGGLRFLISGGGGPGSLFLTPLIGVAGVTEMKPQPRDSRSGFSLALGAEFRL